MTSVSRRIGELPGELPQHLGAVGEPGPPHEIRLRVKLLAFRRAAHMLKTAGARFVTLFVADTPEPAVVGVFALRGSLVVLRAPTDGADPVTYGSLGEFWPAARWAERELSERHGVHPLGAPMAGPLATPDADALDRSVAWPRRLRDPVWPGALRGV